MKISTLRITIIPAICLALLDACPGGKQGKTDNQAVNAASNAPNLPKPYETKSSTNFCKVIGWGDHKPVAPKGFKVTKYADSLKSARWVYQLPNGDILVAQANHELGFVKQVGATIIGASKSGHTGGSPNKITLLRDANKDGIPEIRTEFISGINRPFGMLLLGNSFYVAANDALWVFPYKTGELAINDNGKKLIDLPQGDYNRHWTRNIIANADGSKIYIAVGSASNVAEHGIEAELRRACILEINPDGTGEKVYAAGLRNPVGMGWAPGTHTLWTAVNERDELGDDLVPDYATGVVENGFYGWPYSYFGQNEDPRIKEEDKRPDLVKKAIVPEVNLGAHTASLGLAFCNSAKFPSRYHDGMFIGQRGSWNRKDLSGYKVVFVPFKNGKPSGPAEDFLTGFIAEISKSEVYGRPVGVTFLHDGSLLVADDGSDIIWRISY